MNSKKETWIQVPKTSKFANVGVDFDGEINFFKIIFIDDLYEVGFVVIDPDGRQIAINTVDDEDSIETRFEFDGRMFLLQMYLTGDTAYEIVFTEKQEFNFSE